MGFKRPFSTQGSPWSEWFAGMDLTNGIERNRGSHMANLFDGKAGKFFKIMAAIAERMSPKLGDAICDPDDGPKVVDVMIEAAIRYLGTNPYRMSVEQQLAALRRANDEEGWGIPEHVFVRLAATAPEWPEGRHVYRSLRVRFGEEGEGVHLTFERHIARIKAVFGEKHFWRCKHLYSSPISYKGKDVECLRLFVGDDTHHPVVEWVIVDLDANRKRASVEAVRGPDSLADELLVFAWMFPDRIRDMNLKKLPALFAGGYELSVHDYPSAPCPWWNVLIIFYRPDEDGEPKVFVNAQDHDNNGKGYSVPKLLQPSPNKKS